MRKKAIAIWVLTTITFISLVHLIESITVIMLNNPIRLLQLYPFINVALKALTPTEYLYISAVSTAVLWGITCLVAFHNPVELYLSKREETETQLQDKTELIDRMCETLESDHQTLTQLTDLIHNMQKGMTDGQSPNSITLTPLIQTTSLKNKQLQLKTHTSKPSAQLAKTATKPQKQSLLHKNQKASKKKDEKLKIKITTHSAIPSLREIK